MKFSFLLLLLLFGKNISAKNEYSWKYVKTEVYKVYYNVYVNQWFKETTSELNVFEVSIDENVSEAKIRFRNFSDSVVYWGLDDLEYYKLFKDGRATKLRNDVDVTSLMYEAGVNKEAEIPFYLCCMDSMGSFFVKVKMKVSDYTKYYIYVYLEKIKE